MSTDIGVLKNAGSKGVDIQITRYYGGNRVGPCLQLTMKMEDGRYGYVQLSGADVIGLMPEFNALAETAFGRNTIDRSTAD